MSSFSCKTTFSARLDLTILAGRATIGQFDGKHYGVAVASPGGMVTVYWPHAPDSNQVLRVNRDITSICSGRLSDQAVDILFVGTPTNLMAYDMHSNRDVFFKDVADGVNVVIVGSPTPSGNRLALIGGNCSVLGFDVSGEEQFWTVTGDNVSSLALCDVDSDGACELLVGSEDCQIRVYRSEQVIWETTETDAVTLLCSLRGNCFAYALSSGAVGVYESKTRLWSTKWNAKVTSLAAYDFDGDGVPEVVVGLSDGTIEVRLLRHGTTLYTDTMGSSIACILQGDIRTQGNPELIVCAVDGQIRGYQMADEVSQNRRRAGMSASDAAALDKMKKRFHELERELHGYEANISALQNTKSSNAGCIPSDTQISCSLGPSTTQTNLELRMKTSNDTVIKVVMIFAANIFDSESFMMCPSQPESGIVVPLPISKNVGCELSIKVVCGYKGSIQDHVFELVHKLPKFSSFVYNKLRDMPAVSSMVTMPLKERVSRVILWLNQSFLLDYKARDETAGLSISFTSMHNNMPLIVAVTNEAGGQFQLRTDDMQLAGDIIHDLCGFLSIENSTSKAVFPKDMMEFESLLREVDQFNDLRRKMCTDMVDTSNLAKVLVIKAEDARILENMSAMKNQYSELIDINNELIGELNKRANNHTALLEALKKVNLMIQRAARLRVGSDKARMIQACRTAMKNNNMNLLVNIITHGSE